MESPQIRGFHGAVVGDAKMHRLARKEGTGAIGGAAQESCARPAVSASSQKAAPLDKMEKTVMDFLAQSEASAANWSPEEKQRHISECLKQVEESIVEHRRQKLEDFYVEQRAKPISNEELRILTTPLSEYDETFRERPVEFGRMVIKSILGKNSETNSL